VVRAGGVLGGLAHLTRADGADRRGDVGSSFWPRFEWKYAVRCAAAGLLAYLLVMLPGRTQYL
jgi:hypothetical protein